MYIYIYMVSTANMLVHGTSNPHHKKVNSYKMYMVSIANVLVHGTSNPQHKKVDSYVNVYIGLNVYIGKCIYR